MTTWQYVWHHGIAPGLSVAALEALRKALETDDPRLVQGKTMEPVPLHCNYALPVQAACAIGYCGWHGNGYRTVAEVEEYFARTCAEVDQRLGEPAAVRYFLNWFDDIPRAEMRQLMLVEVNKSLRERHAREVGGVDDAETMQQRPCCA